MTMRWKDWWQHPEFQRGMRDMAAASPGVAAWGLMTGVAMVNSGMSPFEAVAMSLLVFAGSAQLAAMPLIAVGAPIWVIWATAFCVNLRFVVFSAHLRAYFMHLPLRWRLFNGYLVADLGYVLFTQRFPKPATDDAGRTAELAYLNGGNLFGWVAWQLLSMTGIALAHTIPLHWGLGFAGILALLGIGCSLASSPLRRVSAGVAAMAAVAAFALPFKLHIVVAIAAAVALCLVLEPKSDRERHA